jgi:predicted dehydrogenase
MDHNVRAVTGKQATTAAADRRRFLKTSTAALAGSVLLARGVHAGGEERLRIGLVGCGGRGTGAAADALRADPHTVLTAMGDTFSDRLESSLNNLQKQFPADRLEVPPERRFTGFDAYRQVIDSGIDVVLLCTPPHFRPLHLEYAVNAGKHVFAEKPVAVDAPGVHRVLAATALAKAKGLCIVSGLCYRYDLPKREIMARIHDGAVGEIVAIHTTYNTGTLWLHPRQPEWSEMEYQVRNWLYYTWLSGDHNVEQHVHSLDKAAWALHDDSPLAATGLGGRQVRVQPEYGNIYDHHAVVYEFKAGVKVFSFCRQQAGCSIDVSDYVMGTRGMADLMRHEIVDRSGKRIWKYDGPTPNMYQQEHDELFAAIRAGRPINNGIYMANSSMIAIMGRMATYTGQTITWEDATNSQEDLTPPAYEWGPAPRPTVAMPGITQFA